MNMWTKKRIRPDQLLRRKSKSLDVTHFKNSDELEAHLARKREAMN